MHAVLVPIFDNAEMVKTYLNFLSNQNDYIDVSLCKYENDHWNIDKKVIRLHWPKDGVLYPKD